MRSDPLEAYRKYWPIKSAAEKAGLVATISIRQEQPDALEISKLVASTSFTFFNIRAALSSSCPVRS